MGVRQHPVPYLDYGTCTRRPVPRLHGSLCVCDLLEGDHKVRPLWQLHHHALERAVLGECAPQRLNGHTHRRPGVGDVQVACGHGWVARLRERNHAALPPLNAGPGSTLGACWSVMPGRSMLVTTATLTSGTGGRG